MRAAKSLSVLRQKLIGVTCLRMVNNCPDLYCIGTDLELFTIVWMSQELSAWRGLVNAGEIPMIHFIENGGYTLRDNHIPGFDIIAAGRLFGHLKVVSTKNQPGNWGIAKFPLEWNKKGYICELIMDGRTTVVSTNGSMDDLFKKIRKAIEKHGTKAWQILEYKI